MGFHRAANEVAIKLSDGARVLQLLRRRRLHFRMAWAHTPPCRVPLHATMRKAGASSTLLKGTSTSTGREASSRAQRALQDKRAPITAADLDRKPMGTKRGRENDAPMPVEVRCRGVSRGATLAALE